MKDNNIIKDLTFPISLGYIPALIIFWVTIFIAMYFLNAKFTLERILGFGIFLLFIAVFNWFNGTLKAHEIEHVEGYKAGGATDCKILKNFAACNSPIPANKFISALYRPAKSNMKIFGTIICVSWLMSLFIEYDEYFLGDIILLNLACFFIFVAPSLADFIAIVKMFVNNVYKNELVKTKENRGGCLVVK